MTIISIALRFLGILLLCSCAVLGLRLRNIQTTIPGRAGLYFLTLSTGGLGLSLLLWGDDWYPIALFAAIMLPAALFGSAAYAFNQWTMLMVLRKSQEIAQKAKSDNRPQIEKYARDVAQPLERGLGSLEELHKEHDQ